VRIAYMIEQVAPGGAERQLTELLKRIDRGRFEPLVISGSGEGFMVERVRDLEIPLHLLRERPGGGKAATIGAVRALRAFRPTIIHSWGFTPNTWGAVAKLVIRRPQPKLIAGIRGYSGELTGLQALVERRFQSIPDATVSNTSHFAEAWVSRGVDPATVHVIPNGIDLSRFPNPGDTAAAKAALNIPVNAQVVGMVASFRPVKRWDIFLRACGSLSKRMPLRVLAIGDGADRAAMEVLADELGFGKSVTFFGHRADVDTIIPAMDILVSASENEGFSNTILEAMAAAVPVVATRVGGTPEVVVDDDTGILMEPGSADQLRAALERLLSDPSRAREMGKAARQRVEENFKLEVITTQTQGLYDQLLAGTTVVT
jgi:glycosyltransferase involved in cell wall biosynthesis